MEIENLIAGGTIDKELNETLTHNEIYDNIENIWSLLYMTGYLTATEKPRGHRHDAKGQKAGLCGRGEGCQG